MYDSRTLKCKVLYLDSTLLAQQLLEDIKNELNWQQSLSESDIQLGDFLTMAHEALIEEQERRTEDKGFGED
ncbi:hypothetical protein [Trichothermofontia sp.]